MSMRVKRYYYFLIKILKKTHKIKKQTKHTYYIRDETHPPTGRSAMINEPNRAHEGCTAATQVKYKSPEGRPFCNITRNNGRNAARGGSSATHTRRFRRFSWLTNINKRNTCFVCNFNETFVVKKTPILYFAQIFYRIAVVETKYIFVGYNG